MKLDLNLFRIRNSLEVKAGRVIISEPLTKDGFFGRSVVLITEHNEKGSVGFILNKPTGLKIGNLVSDLKHIDSPVYLGGPVASDTVHFIHTSGETIPGSVKIKQNLYWGGQFEVLPELFSKNLIERDSVRFFVGYSGWSEHQLEDELTKNFWVVSKLNNNYIMNASHKGLWKDAVKQLGTDYRFWMNIPDDPEMN
jgi:putative transcriptional regulator